MIYYARRKGENYGSNNNRVNVSISGSWTQFGLEEDNDRVIDFQAVLWDGSSGNFLTLRDKYGDVIYYNVSAIAMVEPEILISPITIRLPIEYLTNEVSSSMRIWGKYV